MSLLGPLFAMVVAPCVVAGEAVAPRVTQETLVYVGTYTGAKGKGIYLFRLQAQQTDQVALVPLGIAAEAASPSFLALDPKRRLLFAVNEIDSFRGKASGAVSAFRIDPATGKLTLINQQPSLGTGPCHVILDATGRNVLVANYGSGSVAVLPVAADGTLGEASSFVQHAGKSVNPSRQAGPHAHCVTLDPTNRFAFVCDLGLDQVKIYRFDPERGKLTAADPAFVAVKPGSGPRHMAFRPDGKFAYLINEMSSTITVFAFDGESGRLREVETVSSLAPRFAGQNSGAEIAVLPTGKVLFVSNRGADALVQFAIDGPTGRLTFVAEQATGGKKPRHFGLAADGRLLAAANQDSGTVQLYRVDPANGRLRTGGAASDVPAPACVVFLPPAGGQ